MKTFGPLLGIWLILYLDYAYPAHDSSVFFGKVVGFTIGYAIGDWVIKKVWG